MTTIAYCDTFLMGDRLVLEIAGHRRTHMASKIYTVADKTACYCCVGYLAAPINYESLHKAIKSKLLLLVNGKEKVVLPPDTLKTFNGNGVIVLTKEGAFEVFADEGVVALSRYSNDRVLVHSDGTGATDFKTLAHLLGLDGDSELDAAELRSCLDKIMTVVADVDHMSSKDYDLVRADDLLPLVEETNTSKEV